MYLIQIEAIGLILGKFLKFRRENLISNTFKCFILVSVIDIESSFAIHALCYAIWIIALNFNMLFNVILQHYSGCRQLTDNVSYFN